MEEQKNEHNSERVWVIVDSGTRRLIGQITQSDLEYAQASNTAPIAVYQAVELKADLHHISTPRGLMGMYRPSLTPVDSEDAPIDMPTVFVSNIRPFSTMQDKGALYGQMYTEFLEGLERQKAGHQAQQAGILLASQMPNGGLRRGS